MNFSDTTNYFKSECANCGVHVEIPNEIYDTTVNCPSCNQAFLAKPIEHIETTFPKTSAKLKPNYFNPKRLFIKSLWIGLVIFCIAAGLAIAFGFKRFHKEILEATGNTFVAVVALLIGFLILIWAILWIVFPVFVYFGMQRMEKILKQIEKNSRNNS